MALPVVRSSQPTTGWDPFRELNELHTQLHRWMDSVLERTSGLTADPLSWSPLADLSETEDAYLVEWKSRVSPARTSASTCPGRNW